jgi:chitodextrinase
VRLVWVDRSLEMGFEVQSRVEGGGPWLNQAPSLGANTRVVTVSGLAASTRHEFRLRAIADGVASDWSAVRSALTLAAPPPAPVPSLVAVQSRRIEISWALEGAVDEILIERQTGRDSAPWVALVRLPGSARGWTDTDVLPENLYHYRFQSTRDGLLSSWATLRNVLTPAVVVPPDAPPFILAGSTASTRVAVYWTLTTRANGYIVERLGEPGQWLEAGRTGPTVTSFTDTGLHPDTAYIYRVRAFNAGGVSTPSLTALTTTPSQWVEWRLLQFGSPSATGPAASLAVKDDGTTNLVRFAFNLPASGPAPTLAPHTDEGLPRIWLHQPSGRLRVEYVRRRPELDPGVSYAVEFGNGAEAFSESGIQISVERVNDSFERVVWEDTQGIDTHSTRLARLRVVEQP